VNPHYHSGAAGGSWPNPSLTIRRLVRGVALCAILLELAASSVTKSVHEKAASYYAWDTIRPLGSLPIAFVGGSGSSCPEGSLRGTRPGCAKG